MSAPEPASLALWHIRLLRTALREAAACGIAFSECAEGPGCLLIYLDGSKHSTRPGEAVAIPARRISRVTPPDGTDRAQWLRWHRLLDAMEDLAEAWPWWAVTA